MRGMFFCSRIRENLVRFLGRHPNSHESGYSQHTPLTVSIEAGGSRVVFVRSLPQSSSFTKQRESDTEAAPLKR